MFFCDPVPFFLARRFINATLSRKLKRKEIYMGRPGYKIKTSTDFHGAYRWIKKKFKDELFINFPAMGSFEENIKAKEE